MKSHKTFGGQTVFREHDSLLTGTVMKFATFVPEGEARGVLIWLSGLTCTEENFISKAGAQRALARAGLIVVCPDTSPRGLQLPREHESSDFGSGAGFYVDATTPGYRDHYKMFSYVADELFAWVKREFQLPVSISGHSMGGHGALTIGLTRPAQFASVSAFSPIVNPVRAPWGRKALAGYLGEDSAAWKNSDACELLLQGKRHPQTILIDQGEADPFLAEQLLTANFTRACGDQKHEVRMQPGYDHSYYFISTFIDDHVEFHARHLAAAR